MKRPNIRRLSTRIAVFCTSRTYTFRDRLAHDDEGSELIAMAILAGTLAGLAYLLYIVIKGKALGWVHKIPSAGSR